MFIEDYMNLKSVKHELDNIKRTSFGISIPEVRKLAQRIAKNDYKEFLENNDFSSFELKILHALTIGYIKEINLLLLKLQITMKMNLVTLNVIYVSKKERDILRNITIRKTKHFLIH